MWPKWQKNAYPFKLFLAVTWCLLYKLIWTLKYIAWICAYNVTLSKLHRIFAFDHIHRFMNHKIISKLLHLKSLSARANLRITKYGPFTSRKNGISSDVFHKFVRIIVELTTNNNPWYYFDTTIILILK